jgi:hypothetical protein
MELPSKMPMARDHIYRKFGELLAQYMPLDLVIDEETVDGHEARVSKTSVCGSWGAIAGVVRYFADRSGTPRAGIEGTQIPMHLIRRYATRGVSNLSFDPRRKGGLLVLETTLEYFGFELEREVELIEDFTPEIADQARHALAEALARGQIRHPSIKRNRAKVEEIRETYRRSGGITPRFGLADLTRWYEERLNDVNSVNEFRNLRLKLDPDEIVPSEIRERYAALPSTAIIRDREVDVEYDVEGEDGEKRGVARLRLPEKLARNMVEAELPTLDRPLRFVVTRGQRGAVRADSLDELQEALDLPWSPEEEAEPYRDQPSRHRERPRENRGGRSERHGRKESRRHSGRRRKFRGR